MLHPEIPCFFDGVDYSDFHPRLFEIYRNDHLKSLGIKNFGRSGIKWYQDVKEGKIEGVSVTPDFILRNHGDLSFHEVFTRGGAKAHLENCIKQYARSKYKVSKKFVKVRNILP